MRCSATLVVAVALLVCAVGGAMQVRWCGAATAAAAAAAAAAPPTALCVTLRALGCGGNHMIAASCAFAGSLFCALHLVLLCAPLCVCVRGAAASQAFAESCAPRRGVGGGGDASGRAVVRASAVFCAARALERVHAL